MPTRQNPVTVSLLSENPRAGGIGSASLIRSQCRNHHPPLSETRSCGKPPLSLSLFLSQHSFLTVNFPFDSTLLGYRIQSQTLSPQLHTLLTNPPTSPSKHFSNPFSLPQTPPSTPPSKTSL